MAVHDLLEFVWNHPLNAGHRVAALRRVVWWQLACRVYSGSVALPFVEGTSLFTTKGTTGATGNWYCGLHELPDMAFVLHLLRPNEHFLDVGANVGSYTVLAAGAVGAMVTSVEPIPRTFVHLQRNISLNGLAGSVNACQNGVSDAAGTLHFTEHLDTVNHVVSPGEDGPTVEVPVRTVDDLVGRDIPVLIKMDVEGYERQALLGARRTLANPRLVAVVMELNGSGARYGSCNDDLMSFMSSYGFSACAYDPFQRRLLEATSCSPDSDNTLFVRNRTMVDARVR